MENNLRPFVIADTESVLRALEMIDENRKGFLIVAAGGTFLGTLTDGDIRRAFIRGATPGSPVAEVYTRGSVTLDAAAPVARAIQLFSDGRIKFLPILDGSGRLVNILTKKQLQVASLCNLQVDLRYDFLSLDENLIDHELTHKPWGFYKTTVINDFYQSKVLSLAPLSSISLQRHQHREEHWLVVFGSGEAQIAQSVIGLAAGSFVFVPKGCLHQLRNTSPSQTLVVVEVQLGESFDEDDIERFEAEPEH